MTKQNLWWAKFLSKNIEKNEAYLKRIKISIKRDKIALKKNIKGLTKKEHLEYRFKIGDIEQADYQVIKQKMEDDTNVG